MNDLRIISIDYKKGYYNEDKELFKRILLKTHFENKSTTIFYALQQVKYNTDNKINLEKVKEYLEYNLNLATSLYILKQENVKINSVNDSTRLHPKLKNTLIDILEKKYKEENLNTIPMTMDLIKDLHKKNKLDHITSILKEGDINYQQLDINDIIGFPEECEITLLSILIQIKLLKLQIKQYNKVTLIKNIKLFAAMKIFELFNLKCCANDLKIVFDSCNFFNLIDKELINTWKKSNTKYNDIQYMKSIYKETKKYHLLIRNKEKYYRIRSENISKM